VNPIVLALSFLIILIGLLGVIHHQRIGKSTEVFITRILDRNSLEDSRIRGSLKYLPLNALIFGIIVVVFGLLALYFGAAAS
jgi:uncharacterized protein YjeT (DUF2065 family)